MHCFSDKLQDEMLTTTPVDTKHERDNFTSEVSNCTLNATIRKGI